MKISIGMNLVPGPWGGGIQFGRQLSEYLIKNGEQVVYSLDDDDIDLILLTDPRTELISCAFNDIDIKKYVSQVNKKVVIVHRINECDERKGTKGLNQRIIQANSVAHYTIFVSRWLQDLYLQQGILSKHYSVILNGSDTTIFNRNGYEKWDHQEPLRIVTHHWGANWLKGFDIYQKLDFLLKDPEFSHRFRFTYIGNLPEGFHFNNSDYIAPLSGIPLAQKIKENHIYITASQNEPGGHHQNEGALCGLPLLFRDSGCMPEYCTGYGLSFSQDDFINKIEMMRDEYDYYYQRMHHYPHTSERMAKHYYKVFQELIIENTHTNPGLFSCFISFLKGNKHGS